MQDSGRKPSRKVINWETWVSIWR